ncbi:MAG: PAS domain S-box protein [Polyangiaceae bacterium]|nr:PAS domain S-box protein [Polyangiaceae bacterium]
MTTDFAHFFELSLDLLATLDRHGRFLDLNPAWADATGHSREALIGANITDFSHPEELHDIAETMGRVTTGTPISNYETRFRCKDGSYKWFSWTASFHDGDDLAYVVARDVSTYHAAMEERDRAIEESHRIQGELERRQERQQEALTAMSTPIIEVWDDVVTLPVVGIIDSTRAGEMKEALLQAVSRRNARIAIVDMTGVEVVDTATADHIVRLMQGVKLLGAQGIITGIQPQVAQIMVSLGVEIGGGVITLRSLREALRYSLRVLGYRIVAAGA